MSAQSLKEFLFYGFLRDDFKSLVKSAPRIKDLQRSFSRSQTLAEEEAESPGLDDVELNVINLAAAVGKDM